MNRAHQSRDREETAARRRWVGFIVGFFLIQGALWAAALAFVANDPSHAVLPDYSEKALAWDQHVQAESRSRKLGWKIDVAMEPMPQDGGRWVHVDLLDDQGKPIVGARVEMIVFHQARAKERQTVLLKQGSDSAYHGSSAIDRPGKWRFEITATRGHDRFFIQQTHVVGAKES